MLEVIREEHPDAVVSISSEVLREYREYERLGDHPGRRRGEAQGRARTSPTSATRLERDRSRRRRRSTS